ncbi:hypothetical protein CA951_03125 [Rhodococcus sp. NCIMB 12038]|nr:hypothetical protein CA951_03125 [Rhodococcus sp. NCIMB 12038]
MRASKLLGNLCAAAWLGAIGSAFMVVFASIFYFFTSPTDFDKERHPEKEGTWLLFTGYGWMKAAAILAVLALIFYVMESVSKKVEDAADAEQRQRDEKERQERAAREQDASRQQQLKNSIENANATALRMLNSLPDDLANAVAALERADVDWKERVYNPFWNSVEECACHLDAYKKAVQEIDSCADRYKDAARDYNGQVPPFAVSSISLESLQSYAAISDAMAKYTRRAQGDRDFAQIFEMWRGNAIMERGFANLQTAVRQVGAQISSQISALSSSIDGIAGSIDNQSHSMIASINRQSAMQSEHHSNLERSLNASQQHEKQIAKRLWNIEHGYKSMF